MMSEEEQALYNKIQNDIIEQNQNSRSINNAHQALFGGDESRNLIDKQLDMEEVKEELFHLLSGHILKRDDKGNMDWTEPDDLNLKPFNEYGVKLIMNILSFYLNKNIILSNYDEDIINRIVWKEIGPKINNFIFCKYEDMMATTDFEKEFNEAYGSYGYKCLNKDEFLYNKKTYKITDDMWIGVDTLVRNHIKEKEKLYDVMFLLICHSIEATYRRALHGSENKNLRTARVVTQSENLSGMGNFGGVNRNIPSYSQPQKQGMFRRIFNV